MEDSQTGTQPAGAETTRVLGPTGDGGTMTEPTRMGAGITCPVCATINSALEQYCSECGFLLASTPGTIAEDVLPPESAFELVEDRTGRAFPLHEGDNTVGRENCDVLLMEPTVSRRHGCITVRGSAVEVADSGSTNGTLVDGMPVVAGSGRPASPGSVIQFGNMAFTLRAAGSEEVPSAVPQETIERTAAMQAGTGSPTVEVAAWLRAVDQADRSAKDIPISAGSTTVGRRAGNDYVISGDPYVSGRHAELRADGPAVTITDLGSTNGTLVNGMRLAPSEPVELQQGDEVSIGQSRYVFELVDNSRTPPGMDEVHGDFAEGDTRTPDQENAFDRPTDDLETESFPTTDGELAQ